MSLVAVIHDPKHVESGWNALGRFIGVVGSDNRDDWRRLGFRLSVAGKGKTIAGNDKHLATQGRLDEAVKEVRLAESLDPLSPIIGWNVARILGFARRTASLDLSDDQAEMLDALDLALGKLRQTNARLSRVVECRFFAGMSIADTAVALDSSPATIKRDWVLPRAWPYREMHSQGAS